MIIEGLINEPLDRKDRSRKERQNDREGSLLNIGFMFCIFACAEEPKPKSCFSPLAPPLTNDDEQFPEIGAESKPA